MPTGKLVAVEGASAAGKSTVLEAVARATGWSVLPEAFRRLMPPPSLRFESSDELLDLERRLLREDARRYVEGRAQARAGATVLADTGFLGPLTYTWALAALRAAPASVLPPLGALARELHRGGMWGLADSYLYLDTPRRIRSARAAADPEGHPADLAGRHAAAGDLERRFYLERFAPLMGPRFRSVPGGGTLPVVAERVAAAARARPARPFADGSVEPVLALLEVPHPARGNC